jgi:hypothetical protein
MWIKEEIWGDLGRTPNLCPCQSLKKSLSWKHFVSLVDENTATLASLVNVSEGFLLSHATPETIKFTLLSYIYPKSKCNWKFIAFTKVTVANHQESILQC